MQSTIHFNYRIIITKYFCHFSTIHTLLKVKLAGTALNEEKTSGVLLSGVLPLDYLNSTPAMGILAIGFGLIYKRW